MTFDIYELIVYCGMSFLAGGALMGFLLVRSFNKLIKKYMKGENEE